MNKMSINPTVIVNTYNQPNELDLVFYALNKQKVLPYEILIADDGSTLETKEIISKWCKLIPVPIKHIWQEDSGNRKFLICDLSVQAAQGNYIIFLDGDSIPHPHWVNDHIQAARDNTVLCGRRVRLGPKISRQLNSHHIESGKLFSLISPILFSALTRDSKRYSLGIRLPKVIARCLHPKERRLMGVNFSLPKVLYERIGGYANSYNKNQLPSVMQREDAQLEIKLISAGAKRFPLLNRAIVYHLYHEERPITEEINRQIQAKYESALSKRKASINQ